MLQCHVASLLRVAKFVDGVTLTRVFEEGSLEIASRRVVSQKEELDNLLAPRRYFRCCFICFLLGAVQFLNVLNLTLLCVQSFNSVKVNELPPVWERATNAAYHLLFYCLLRYVCQSFLLILRTSFWF